jgi:hypothetical protein
MTDSNPLPSGPHLEPFEVTHYLANTLLPDDRCRVERHLADCEPCTEEVVAIARLSRRPAFQRWLPYAAAAAVLAGIVVLAPRPGPGVSHDTLRNGASTAVIAVVAPEDGAVVGRAPTLVWRSVPRTATYRVMVTRADGDSIWAVQTSDTAVTMPESVVSDSGVIRHWYVDALLSDGSSVSTGMREFRTGR